MTFLSYEITISSVVLPIFCLQLLDFPLEPTDFLSFSDMAFPDLTASKPAMQGVLNLEARDGAFLLRNLRRE
jgi:hypothetical protein